ncbi:hypothetical protein [Candidatus Macondimonas diazotrophica]|uniref:Uncharacterized protein n=1 Tax=Candidatus Macondimonas diazotrophica TaxID=2305248 RepID=A0A4Z0F776_9GAMM|nr:hypothetical protein [Candidatus Macondimonas diazotrophica]NCU02227.1 hypothetical protein [Candidatus Macondimonas diazotrophica]TFZ81233.1 hypothetical protein E4680_13300 [Candidatus Macondimonas diazotrophica]
MATFAGREFTTTQPKTPDDNPHLAAQLYRYVLDYYFAGPRDAQEDPVFRGARTLDLEPIGATRSGAVRPGLLEDFYFRIHLIPRTVDVGNVIVPKTETVYFWNAFLSDANLTAINATHAEGLSLTGPTPTVVAAPLAMFEYTLTADPEGPASIDATYGFVVDGITYDLRILGVRFALFPVDPNQGEPLEETLEWRTAILTAGDETEQAISQRAVPRRTFAYTLAADGVGRQTLEHLLWSAQWRALSIPVWTDAAQLAAPLNSGGMSLSLSGDSLFAFRDGGVAILWASPTQHEVVDIATWTPGTLTTARAVAQSWPAGTEVFPGTFGYLPAEWAQQRRSAIIDIARTVIELDPARDDANLPVAAAPVTHAGIEVYLEEPNWRDAPDAGWSAYRDEFDPGIGPWARWPRQTFSAFWRSYAWLLEGRPAIQDFRAFLARRAGARVPVYLPTWQDDLTLVQHIGASDVAARFALVDPAGLLGTHPTRQVIALVLRDGTVIVRGISNPVNHGDGTISLDLSSATGQLVLTSDVALVCYVPLWRMSDAVTLVWHTAEVVECGIRFRAINP